MVSEYHGYVAAWMLRECCVGAAWVLRGCCVGAAWGLRECCVNVAWMLRGSCMCYMHSSWMRKLHVLYVLRVYVSAAWILWECCVSECCTIPAAGGGAGTGIVWAGAAYMLRVLRCGPASAACPAYVAQRNNSPCVCHNTSSSSSSTADIVPWIDVLMQVWMGLRMRRIGREVEVDSREVERGGDNLLVCTT